MIWVASAPTFKWFTEFWVTTSQRMFCSNIAESWIKKKGVNISLRPFYKGTESNCVYGSRALSHAWKSIRTRKVVLFSTVTERVSTTLDQASYSEVADQHIMDTTDFFCRFLIGYNVLVLFCFLPFGGHVVLVVCILRRNLKLGRIQKRGRIWSKFI